jgi:hypothetical protein
MQLFILTFILFCLDNGERFNVTIVKDFLPPVNQLVPKQKTVMITMEFTQESIEFFKLEAKRSNSSYQEMICHLVDDYAKQRKV